jgi:hypothetical protein
MIAAMRPLTQWLLAVAAILAALNALVWANDFLALLPPFRAGVYTLGNVIYGMLFSVLAGGAAAWLLWAWLGKFLGIDKGKPCWTPDGSAEPKFGFPPCIVGVIERIAFTLLVVLQFGDVLTAMMAWLGLKLAAAWEPRLRRAKPIKAQIGAFRALLVGLVSLLFAAIGGKLAFGVWW